MTIEPLGRGIAAALLAIGLTAGAAWADNHEAKPADATSAEETKAEDSTKAEDTKAEDTKAETAAETTAPEPKYVLGDIPLGAEDAPVTIIEYAAFTCPHCANFHRDNWAKLKENYIDTGKVRFILREVYFHKYGLWASMTARCGGAEGFYPMADVFLETQDAWTRAPDVSHAIHQIGRRAGLSNERLEACLSDRDYAKALVDSYKENATADDVRSTPTFFINGEKFTGEMSFEDFSALIDSKLGS